jgi:RNA polymerase primary sigma factor
MNFQKSESLSRYFDSIKDLNPLTKEDEQELGKLAQAGDRTAIEALVRYNLKIVVRIANKNVGRGIPVDDLIQEGNLGLYDAAHRFDPDQNVRFSSFASTRILKYMNALIDTCGRIVRIPVNQEYERYLALKKGDEVSDLRPVKLDDFLDDENGKTKADTVLSVSPSVEQEHDADFFKIQVETLLGGLKERDREIVKLYFGIDCAEETPTAEIAEQVGLTQIRVCQIISSAKKKMKEAGEKIY